MLSDFSFTPPEQILKGLKGGMQMASKQAESAWKKNGRDGFRKMSGSKGDLSPVELVAQQWDDQKQRLVRTTLRGPGRTLTLNTMPSLQTVARLMTRKSFLFMLENPYCSV